MLFCLLYCNKSIYETKFEGYSSIILSVALTSCENMQIRKQMKAFMKSEIVLPEDLHHVCGRSMETSSEIDAGPVHCSGRLQISSYKL